MALNRLNAGVSRTSVPSAPLEEHMKIDRRRIRSALRQSRCVSQNGQILLPNLFPRDTLMVVVSDSPGSYTHGGELCIIFLTASCGERINPSFADAGPVEMMQG